MIHTSSPPPTATPAPTPAASYWDKTRRMTLALLGVWFLVTFGAVFFARQLDRVNLFGWPLSFYLAAQGVMLIYLAIVVVYTLWMRRAERQLHAIQAASEHHHGD